MGGKLPVFVKASYVAGGEVYYDQSLYVLGVDGLQASGDISPKVTFSGVIHLERLDPDKPFYLTLLDQLLLDGVIEMPVRVP